LVSKSKTCLSIVFAAMLGRCSKTNCLQVRNSTFGSLFITNLLNQEDPTIEMFLYPLQRCSTKILDESYLSKIFLWSNLCQHQRNQWLMMVVHASTFWIFDVLQTFHPWPSPLRCNGWIIWWGHCLYIFWCGHCLYINFFINMS